MMDFDGSIGSSLPIVSVLIFNYKFFVSSNLWLQLQKIVDNIFFLVENNLMEKNGN